MTPEERAKFYAWALKPPVQIPESQEIPFARWAPKIPDETYQAAIGMIEDGKSHRQIAETLQIKYEQARACKRWWLNGHTSLVES